MKIDMASANEFYFIFETKRTEVPCIKREKKIHPRPKRQAKPEPRQAGEMEKLNSTVPMNLKSEVSVWWRAVSPHGDQGCKPN
jgi:hypothetical protein